MTNVALGADLLDKNQKCLTGKGVRGAAKMPIVGMDLWGDGAFVGYFPPVDKDEDGELSGWCFFGRRSYFCFRVERLS